MMIKIRYSGNPMMFPVLYAKSEKQMRELFRMCKEHIDKDPYVDWDMCDELLDLQDWFKALYIAYTGTKPRDWRES